MRRFFFLLGVAAALAASAKTKVACIGDSITYGFGLANRETESYPAQLQKLLDQLRGEKKIPFVMMGLPKLNRPWEPYRAAQKKACEEKGAIFVDTFAAGLGDPNDVHPRNKIPFAELAIKALEK